MSLWIVLSFLTGFLAGIAARDAYDLLHVRRSREAVVPLSTPRNRLMTLILAVTILLNSVAAGLLLLTRKSAEDYASCTAEWQQEFAAAYQARLAASIDVSEAMDDVVRAVYLQDKAGFAKAVTKYVKTRDQQEADRASNPLPSLPDRVCGDPEEVRR